MLIARHLLRERSCDDQRGDAIHDRRIEKMDEGMVTPPCRAPKLAFFRPEEPQFGAQFDRKAVNRENISHLVPLSTEEGRGGQEVGGTVRSRWGQDDEKKK